MTANHAPRPSADQAALELINILLGRTRSIVTWSLAVGASFLVIGLLTRGYESQSRFLPHVGSGGSSRLAGLAAQVGLAIDQPGDGESLAFYAVLVRSPELLGQVVERGILPDSSSSNDSTSRSLADILGAEGDTPEEIHINATRLLRDAVSVQSDLQAGLVTVRVKMPEPRLAESVNRLILELVNEFNVKRRKSRAQQERVFTGERLKAAQEELEEAEARLKAFLESNRHFKDSPQLSFEAARLQRRVDLRQQVYISLAQAYEQARIDEVRDIPVITVLDHPEGSAEPSPRLRIPLLAGILLGLLLGVLQAFTSEYLERRRIDDPEAYAEFVRLRRQFVDLIPSGLWRRLKSAPARRE